MGAIHIPSTHNLRPGGSLNNKFQYKQVLQMKTTREAATLSKLFVDFFLRN